MINFGRPIFIADDLPRWPSFEYPIQAEGGAIRRRMRSIDFLSFGDTSLLTHLITSRRFVLLLFTSRKKSFIPSLVVGKLKFSGESSSVASLDV